MALKSNKSKTISEYHLDSRILLQNLFNQKSEGNLCDIKLQVQGNTIWAHSCVLVSCSSYFVHYFKLRSVVETGWESHWCFQRPLVIDIASELNDDECLCITCVSKVIDFMYLREIAVIPGHFDHFSKIVKFLKVSDLLHLCKVYLPENNLSAYVDGNIVDYKNDMPALYSSTGESDHTYSSKIITHHKHSECDENQLKSLFRNKSLETSKDVESNNYCKALPKTLENTTNNDLGTGINLNDSNHEELTIREVIQNDGSTGKKEKSEARRDKCEFLCCNSNDKLICAVKERKKRKISCEKCSFTSISVQKVLKHLHDTDHIGNYCPICTITIHQNNDMKDHLIKHVGLKPYFCHICKKRNRHWEYHKLHLRVHCRNKPFRCEVCEKSFKNLQNLHSHLSTHKQKYLCSKCNYLTFDKDNFTFHLLKHTDDKIIASSNTQSSTVSPKLIFESNLKNCKLQKEFFCQVCGEGFTKKQNLTRHVQLKHFSVTEFKCSKCDYASKRTDLLKHHMKKHHNCLPTTAEETLWKSMKTKFISGKRKRPEQSMKKSEKIMGVLIPVNLVSTTNSSTYNAFAVKTSSHESFNKFTKISCSTSEIEINNSKTIIEERGYSIEKSLSSKEKENCSTETNINYVTYSPISNQSDMSNLNNIANQSDRYLENKEIVAQHINSVHGLPKENGASIRILEDVHDANKGKEVSMVDLDHSLENKANTNNKRLTDNLHGTPKEMNCLHLLMDNESRRTQTAEDRSEFIENTNEDIWLNESTGELLRANRFLNVHVYDSLHNHLMTSSTKQPSLSDPFQRLIINESSGGLSFFDFGEDKDDFLSNPQTPQANLVEFDDSENLFPLNCLDNGFSSTWVLNETTGELNMVSFGVQPFRNGEELDENARFDDETALFLNEGTGDLSVIYFNPSKSETNKSSQMHIDKLNHENLETLSEHSNDDDDLLTEEFIKASADFMADDGNEKFLNELTGEFDIANFDNYHPNLQDDQIRECESYLNEETGEISWNVLDQNINDKLFTNTDVLNYDFEDSMNCDDLDRFSTKLNDFSFCLENDSSGDWKNIEETCDTLLNEYTGELVKKL